MTSVDTLFPSKYLKASDIGSYRPVVTIHKVTIEEMGKGAEKERKPVLWFAGKEKGMVCNKTNANAIAKIAGSREIEDWKGTTIQLFVAEVEAFGELTEALRVKRPESKGQRREPEPEPFDAEAEAMKAQFDDDAVPF